MESLRKYTEYTDVDIISYDICIMLGIIEPQYNFSTDCKHVFWSRHPVGEVIYYFILEMAKNGILEENPDDNTQYRWSPDFKGSWEKSLGRERNE